MNTDCIMDYSPFELIYEGIRHTTVREHAKDWNLTEEQVETLKAKLLEEEHRISENRLKNAEKLFEKGWRPTIANAESIFDESIISLDELREIMTNLDRIYVTWMKEQISKMDSKIKELDKDAPDYEMQSKRIVNRCAHEIAYSMFCANLQDPRYRYQVEKYKEVLSVQCGTFDMYDRVMQLLNTRNLFEVLNGIWLNDDIKL